LLLALYYASTMTNLLPELYEIIFRQLTSYNRASICTTCKIWSTILIDMADRYKPAISRDQLMDAGEYHTIIRRYKADILVDYRHFIKNGEAYNNMYCWLVMHRHVR